MVGGGGGGEGLRGGGGDRRGLQGQHSLFHQHAAVSASAHGYGPSTSSPHALDTGDTGDVWASGGGGGGTGGPGGRRGVTALMHSCTSTPEDDVRAVVWFEVWMLVVGGLSLWGVSVQKKEHESLYDRRLRKRTRTRRASKPNRSPHAPLLDDHPGGGGVSPSASSSSSSSSSTTAVSSSGGSSSKSLLSGAEVRVSRGRSADRNV